MEVTKLVFGLGFNDRKYPASIGRVNTETYRVWSRMLHRCTNDCHIDHKSYIGTTCSDNFKNYSFFYEWCNKQIGFGNKDENRRSWQLDKDLLIKGNKLYSEDTCVFVPPKMNKLLIKSDAARGECPIGVSVHKTTRKYKASCGSAKQIGQDIYLGLFDTSLDAFLAYKTYKEMVIKEVANEYKEQIDPRAYQALMCYEVNIND